MSYGNNSESSVFFLATVHKLSELFTAITKFSKQIKFHSINDCVPSAFFYKS